jgi:hypothetical protein
MNKIPKALSTGEETFALHCRAKLHPVNQPVREYQFCERKWRFDFAWPQEKLAVEIEGGTWSNGRHSRGSGYESDLLKYNRATALGWRVFRYTPTMVNVGIAINDVLEALK